MCTDRMDTDGVGKLLIVGIRYGFGFLICRNHNTLKQKLHRIIERECF